MGHARDGQRERLRRPKRKCGRAGKERVPAGDLFIEQRRPRRALLAVPDPLGPGAYERDGGHVLTRLYVLSLSAGVLVLGRAAFWLRSGAVSLSPSLSL